MDFERRSISDMTVEELAELIRKIVKNEIKALLPKEQ
jgi:hypothetical protein